MFLRTRRVVGELRGSVLGKVAALVFELAILYGLGLLLRFLSLGGGGSGLGRCLGHLLGDFGFYSTNGELVLQTGTTGGCIVRRTSGGGSGVLSLGLGGGGSLGGGGGRRSLLLGDLDGLLFLGHCIGVG